YCRSPRPAFGPGARASRRSSSPGGAAPLPPDRRPPRRGRGRCAQPEPAPPRSSRADRPPSASRSEEHTSELQSRFDLVCRLLLEKKKKRENTLKKERK